MAEAFAPQSDSLALNKLGPRLAAAARAHVTVVGLRRRAQATRVEEKSRNLRWGLRDIPWTDSKKKAALL